MRIMCLENDLSFPIAKQTAIDFLDCANEHIDKFALGADSYTLADSLLTCMLTRLEANTQFYKEEVEVKRPNLGHYHREMEKR